MAKILSTRLVKLLIITLLLSNIHFNSITTINSSLCYPRPDRSYKISVYNFQDELIDEFKTDFDLGNCGSMYIHQINQKSLWFNIGAELIAKMNILNNGTIDTTMIVLDTHNGFNNVAQDQYISYQDQFLNQINYDKINLTINLLDLTTGNFSSLNLPFSNILGHSFETKTNSDFSRYTFFNINKINVYTQVSKEAGTSKIFNLFVSFTNETYIDNIKFEKTIFKMVRYSEKTGILNSANNTGGYFDYLVNEELKLYAFIHKKGQTDEINFVNFDFELINSITILDGPNLRYSFSNSGLFYNQWGYRDYVYTKIDPFTLQVSSFDSNNSGVVMQDYIIKSGTYNNTQDLNDVTSNTKNTSHSNYTIFTNQTIINTTTLRKGISAPFMFTPFIFWTVFRIIKNKKLSKQK